MLAEVGVEDGDALRKLGALGCYHLLRFRFGKQVTLNFLHALDCAVEGMDWRQQTRERKAELALQARLASS